MIAFNRTRAPKRATWALAALTAAAALTGSQTLQLSSAAASDTGANEAAAAGISGHPADGGAPRLLPQPPVRPVVPPGGTLPGTGSAATGADLTGASLPDTVFTAYRNAESTLASTTPGCHLRWQLLAGIGQVESGQANGGQVDANGTTYTPILGPALDGNGFAAIPDTDGGALDGSSIWDRAVGPMQFIPSTWATWGTDGNHDGKADPNNVFDAALTAGRYLCAGGRDLSDSAQLDRAILSYNYSTDYLNTVENWMRHFESGAAVTPDRPGDPWTAPKPIPLPTPARTPATPGGPASPSPSPSPRPSSSPSATPSPSASPTNPSTSASASASASASPSASASASASASPSPSTSASPSPSPSSSASPSPSPSGPACPTPTATPSPTPTGSASPSPSSSPTASPSGSPSGTPSPSPSPSADALHLPGCPTPTASPSPSGSATPSVTPAPSPSPKHH
ncbi:lytic transglycosylase domain-containing protein [Kitasatospora sp. NPDC056138]|uniref:lytic transglycosylase domain-containing protein n=1 Tax=Kitasatospora sp. NPDC056138 TaxID=3345724 RepID=UPI0035E10D41